MTIEFYSKKNFGGTCTIVNRDMSRFDSGSKLGSTASIKLTSDADRILLFKKKDWDGDVMYLSGKQSVADLGDPKQGGKQGFRNSVSSVRVTNFGVGVRFHVIKRSDGARPRHKMSDQELENYLGKIRYAASRILEDEALIRLKDDGIVYTVNDELFNAKCNPDRLNEIYPDLAAGRAHVFIPNTLNKLGCAGTRNINPAFFLASSTENHTMNEIARTLAHEFGHSWGLNHDGNVDGSRLMTQTADADKENNTRLVRSQVETVHEGLSDKSGAEANFRKE